ncbi:hypothetical protein HYV80_02540 [Candidatus Woesearchaeota archaeon]|nr:hypothetical protein [Candidatus Woesearchaeota archaeon]
MRVTIDTSHDSHDDIKKVIKMLQHLVGDSQEVFTNEPAAAQSPIANIFGDENPGIAAETLPSSSETSQEAQAEEKPAENPESAEDSQSTEDLFAELFSEEELKKMDKVEVKEEEEVKPAKGRKYGIELY